MLLLFAGCKSSQSERTNIPVPVKMTSFPEVAETFGETEVNVQASFLIDPNGAVLDVKLKNPVIDPTWDARAIDSMMTWQFTPFSANMYPDGVWLSRTVRVKFEEPVIMNLFEFEFATGLHAMNFHDELKSGKQPHEIREYFSQNNMLVKTDTLKNVNLSRFPEPIRKELTKMRTLMYTRPLSSGGKYYIYFSFDPEEDRFLGRAN